MAAMASSSPLTPFLALLLIACAAAPLTAAPAGGESVRKVLPGGWAQIKDVNSPHVLKIAEFAVSEQNKHLAANGGSLLALRKVVSGETQVVAGTNYRLVVIAKDSSSGASAKFQAVVYERPWENFLLLISFKLLN